MPGLLGAHHQVARHVVAVHEDARLGEVAREHRANTPSSASRCAGESVTPEVARDVPVGKERQLAAQQRLVVSRQHAGRLAACQRTSAVVASPKSRSTSRPRAALDIERGAQVGEQQEALRQVLRDDLAAR
jgi:hypothetical protein